MNPSINHIWYAINSLERAAERFADQAHGVGQWDRVREMRATAAEARREYAVLEKAMPDFRSYMANRAAEYDRYVTRPDWDDAGCSCHINPPCGYCTRQSDEDDLASADTRPEDGDALAAPLVSGAVGAAETPNGQP